MSDLIALTFVVSIFVAYGGLLLALVVWSVRERLGRDRHRKARQPKTQSKAEPLENEVISR